MSCGGKAQRDSGVETSAGTGGVRVVEASDDVACAGHDNRGGAGTFEAEPEFRACTKNSDCVLSPYRCVLGCDARGAAKVAAVSRAAMAEHELRVCEGAPPRQNASCALNPYLVPHCENGLCVATDYFEQPATECESSEDCVLRRNECCTCADVNEGDLVSVNRSRVSDIDEFLCAEGLECERCEDEPVLHVNPGCRCGRCRVFVLPLQ
jgi:hypothetical protein